MENNSEGAKTGQDSGSSVSGRIVLQNSSAVLVLGIVSIVGVPCSQGLLGIVLGIIGLVLSGTPMKMYKADPGQYTESSVKNLKAGRVCSIIGLSIGGAIFLVVILFVIFIGLAGGFFGLLPFLKNCPIDMITLFPF